MEQLPYIDMGKRIEQISFTNLLNSNIENTKMKQKPFLNSPFYKTYGILANLSSQSNIDQQESTAPGQVIYLDPVWRDRECLSCKILPKRLCCAELGDFYGVSLPPVWKWLAKQASLVELHFES